MMVMVMIVKGKATQFWAPCSLLRGEGNMGKVSLDPDETQPPLSSESHVYFTTIRGILGPSRQVNLSGADLCRASAYAWCEVLECSLKITLVTGWGKHFL